MYKLSQTTEDSYIMREEEKTRIAKSQRSSTQVEVESTVVLPVIELITTSLGLIRPTRLQMGTLRNKAEISVIWSEKAWLRMTKLHVSKCRRTAKQKIRQRLVPFFASHWNNHWSVIRILFICKRTIKSTFVQLPSRSAAHELGIQWLYMWYRINKASHFVQAERARRENKTVDYTRHSTDTHTAKPRHAVGYSCRPPVQTWRNTSENVDLRLLREGLICSDLCAAATWFLKAKVLQCIKPRAGVGASALLCKHR